MNIKAIKAFGFALLVFAIPKPAFACEPVVPLTIVYGLPIISLFGVILVKAVMFAIFEKSLSRFKAFVLMLAANLVSSLIGVALNIGAIAPALSIFAVSIVIGLSYDWSPPIYW